MAVRIVNRREFMAVSAAALLYETGSQAQATDPAALSIAAAGSLLRSRQLAPVQLVDAYLDRIQRLDGRGNSFITVTADRARTRARMLETELAGGRWRGPLHGVPIALKDNIDTAGVRTTAASAVFADRVPGADAEVVTRLEEAGAILKSVTQSLGRRTNATASLQVSSRSCFVLV